MSVLTTVWLPCTETVKIRVLYDDKKSVPVKVWPHMLLWTISVTLWHQSWLHKGSKLCPQTACGISDVKCLTYHLESSNQYGTIFL